MLPDIGASELMVIALVALIFVGPKDLPLMLKRLGQFTSKMRRMAADFRTSFDDMARQSELEDLRREVEQMRANATQAISDPVGVESTFRETMREVDAAMMDDASFDYDPGVPVVEDTPPEATTPEPAAPPAKKRASTKAASTAGAPKARKSPSAKSTTGAAAKPRRRAPVKIVT